MIITGGFPSAKLLFLCGEPKTNEPHGGRSFRSPLAGPSTAGGAKFYCSVGATSTARLRRRLPRGKKIERRQLQIREKTATGAKLKEKKIRLTLSLSFRWVSQQFGKSCWKGCVFFLAVATKSHFFRNCVFCPCGSVERRRRRKKSFFLVSSIASSGKMNTSPNPLSTVYATKRRRRSNKR